MRQSEEFDHLKVEQLVVGKHVKVSSSFGSIEVHASGKTLGMWVSRGGKFDGQIGIVVEQGKGPYISIWPTNDSGVKTTFPFAVSGHGLQVPTSGNPVILSWGDVARLVTQVLPGLSQENEGKGDLGDLAASDQTPSKT